MSRRFTGASALAILAGLSTVSFGLAKPPDLPANPVIIVQPIQYLPCEFETPAGPVYVDRHSVKDGDLPAGRSVLENLNRLLEAGDVLRQAKKHVKDGNLGAALECIDTVRTLVPGSNLDAECDELVAALGKKFVKKAVRSFALGVNSESGLTGSVVLNERNFDVCCACPYVGLFSRVAHCWLSQARHHVAKLNVKDGKSVMVEGLLKAAHLALDEGRTAKAAELVRQAHAISPEAVEADPLVFKLHLLDEGRPAKGGEETSEPMKALPVHPRQAIKAKQADVDPDAVERVEPTSMVTLTIGLMEKAEKVGTFFLAMQFQLEQPGKDHNGVLMFGLTAAGRPTLMLHTRCPVTGVKWHVCVGGAMPVVWKTTD
jgi:hypothetical protein